MKNIISTTLNLLFVVFAFTWSGVAHSASAKPQEIKNFAQVREHVKDFKNTLLLLSIDNTLLKSELLMGQRSWFYHRKDTYAKSGLSDAVAAQKAVNEWSAVLSVFGQKPVASDIAKTIADLQKNKLRIMGVSSRGLGLASVTIQNLADAGIDLSKTAGGKQQDVPLVLGEKLLLYRNGVLFTSGVGKAIALKKLSELVEISRPTKIVMLSHDERSLNLIGEGIALHGKGIAYVPLRYTAMDAEHKSFNAQAADAQFESFKQVLSNEQALAKVKPPKPQPKK